MYNIKNKVLFIDMNNNFLLGVKNIMMNGTQLKEEMSTWVWNLPNFFKINENLDYEDKLINLMLKGLQIFKNSSFNKIKLSDDEERLHKTYIDMLKYIQKVDPSENIEFTYELLFEYYNFIDKKIEFNNNLITAMQYEMYKENYSKILKKHEEYFNKHIFIEDFENSPYFKGYKDEFIKKIHETEKQNSLDDEDIDDLFPNVE